MRPAADQRPRNPAVLSLSGIAVTLAGFGLLTVDAAVGVIAIPAGLALMFAAMPTTTRREYP